MGSLEAQQMKKILFAALFFSFVAGAAAAQQQPQPKNKGRGFWRTTAEMLRAAVPRVTSPALEDITGLRVRISGQGADLVGMQVQVRNATGLPAGYVVEVYAADKKVAELGPGDVASDERLIEWLPNPQIPFLAVLKEGDKVLGMAGTVIALDPSGRMPIFLDLTLESIITPTGNPLSYGTTLLVNPYPNPRGSPERKEMKLPRQWWNATTGVLVGNNSYLTLYADTLEGKRITIHPFGIHYFEDRVIAGRGVERCLNLTWLDGDVQRGYDRYCYQVPESGVYGHSLVVLAPVSATQRYFFYR